VYRAAKSLIDQSRNRGRFSKDDTSAHVDDVMIQDPVCGVYFPQNRAVVLNTDSQTLYFCSAECRDRYLAERS
jgi:uncharacterized protein